MSKFKAGEKIAFYYADHGFPCRNTGVVEEVNKKGALRLHLTDVNEHVNAHPKQCRRLVKKKCSYCAGGSRVYRADAPGQCFNCLRKF